MTVTYLIDENCATKLDNHWPEYLVSRAQMQFVTWLHEVKIPYADSINSTPLGYNIIFKEEKDLTLFLLTL